MTQGIDEQIRVLPAIETEAHLFEVGREMLGTESVPSPHDAALEKRERGFDGVRVNVAHDVHARTMINFSVARSLSFPHGGIVRGCVIGENHFHVLGDVLADVLGERSGLGVTGMEEAQIAVALADANHHFFIVVLCDVTLAAHLAANIGNVHLYFPVQHRLIGLRHGVPDAMTEIPRRFVAHSDCALNLAGRHSLFCFAKQMRRQEPLGEWEMGVIENGIGRDGKLVITILAVEQLFLGFQLDHGAFAAQALRAFWEAETDKKLTALIFGAEQGVYIN